MSLPGYDDWKQDERWDYWDDEPRPVCFRCQGRYSSPTAPYCEPCARVIDEQEAADFNPFARKKEESEMGRYATAPEGGDFETPEPGTYPARCYRVIDLGTQHSDLYGDKNQVMVSWELVGTEMTDGRPFAITRFYTNSLHKKAMLRQHLEAWRGRSFTDDELGGFDLTTILNAPCLLNIGENENGKIKVNAVMAAPKGQTVAPLQNETQCFFLDEPNWEVFKGLSDKLRSMIESTAEYRRAVSGEPEPAAAEVAGDGPEDFTEPPF